MNTERIQRAGVVKEALPNAMFRVETNEGLPILATMSADLRRHQIKILPGDKVTLELSPYDPSRGRITNRQK